MPAAPRVYAFYGCRLATALPLSFPAATAGEAGDADVVLSAGDVAPQLDDPIWTTPFVSVGAMGDVLISVEAVGRFLLRGGHTITLDAAVAVSPVEIEAFVAGPVAGALLHQRDVLPLHASCAEFATRAIALTGSVGRGKSTLATALVRRGARLMTDDVCPVVFGEDDVAWAIPGSSSTRLRSDTREHFGCAGPEWTPVRPGHAKHIGRSNGDTADSSAARQLGAIVRIATTNRAVPELVRLHGPVAVTPMTDLVYRLRLGRLLGRGEHLFAGLMRVANTVPIFELRRPHGFDRIDEVADLLLATLAGGR